MSDSAKRLLELDSEMPPDETSEGDLDLKALLRHFVKATLEEEEDGRSASDSAEVEDVVSGNSDSLFDSALEDASLTAQQTKHAGRAKIAGLVKQLIRALSGETKRHHKPPGKGDGANKPTGPTPTGSNTNRPTKSPPTTAAPASARYAEMLQARKRSRSISK